MTKVCENGGTKCKVDLSFVRTGSSDRELYNKAMTQMWQLMPYNGRNPSAKFCRVAFLSETAAFTQVARRPCLRTKAVRELL